ncbi:MAG: hypothetical protein JWR32_1996 [Mycobacterium sp.]|jgi:hypothetical protein|nr:hypothetical protein [Mycobacterium sp.]
MPRLTKEDRIVRQIIKEYGPQLDLRANPEVFIEIMRKYAMDLAEDGGLPPGGVGPVGPVAKEVGPGLEDVLKEIQKLQRQVTKLAKQIGQ